MYSRYVWWEQFAFQLCLHQVRDVRGTQKALHWAGLPSKQDAHWNDVRELPQQFPPECLHLQTPAGNEEGEDTAQESQTSAQTVTKEEEEEKEEEGEEEYWETEAKENYESQR